MASGAPSAVDPLDELFGEYGVAGRRLIAAAELLLQPTPLTLSAIILQSGLARRSVEQLLRAIDVDPRDVKAAPIRLGDGPGRKRLDAALVAARGTSADHSPAQLSLADVAAIMGQAPKAKRELDHVSATPETLVRRATHLCENFLLAGRHVVLMGDHDLTSIALAASEPRAKITVVDVDDDLLAYIAAVSSTAGPRNQLPLHGLLHLASRGCR